jgi:hypothetical protein
MAARSADSSASRSCQLRNEANLPLINHRTSAKGPWTAAALLPLSAKQPCCEHVFRSPTSQIRKTPPSAHQPSTLAKGPLDCGSPAAAFREAALLRACLPLTDFPDKENATFRSPAFDLGQRPLGLRQPCCRFPRSSPAASMSSLTDFLIEKTPSSAHRTFFIQRLRRGYFAKGLQIPSP